MIFPFGSLYTNHFALIFVSERSSAEEIELVYVLDPQMHEKHIDAACVFTVSVFELPRIQRSYH